MKPTTIRKQILLLLLVFDLTFLPAVSFAGANIPGFYGNMGNLVQPSANQLPVIQNIISGVKDLEKVGSDTLVVHQNQSKAMLDWESFDIGADAMVHFDQQDNTNWAALNRIFDQNPSQIYGRLTADGAVYLINPNGILFSKDAQVNVHILAASALMMAEDDFTNGIMNFSGDEVESDAVVANFGHIETDSSGKVFLMAPNVVNGGTIEAPQGDVFIGAGTEANYSQGLTSEGQVTESFEVNGFGTVTNTAEGAIITDGGATRLYGGVVNHDGLIRAVTSVVNQGVIELRASDTVRTGEESVISTPVSESTDAYHESFSFSAGAVSIQAGSNIELNGAIQAPNGNVTLFLQPEDDTAVESSQGRIYMGGGGSIDVSGEWTQRQAEDQVVSVQLNSVELRDDYQQKESDLKGETVQIKKSEGSSIGIVEGYLNAEEKTAAERATAGGNITIDAGVGEVIIRDDAELDFSGGGYVYEAGAVQTTKLLCGNTIYDISSAPENLQYDRILDETVVKYDRFGIIETFSGIYTGGASPLKSLTSGYIEGADAGSLQINARTVVLNGLLNGSVTIGPYQTETEELKDELGYDLTLGKSLPIGGSLTIGSAPKGSLSYQVSDPGIVEVVITDTETSLPDTFQADSSLGEIVSENGVNPYTTEYYDDGRPFYKTLLNTEMLSNANLSELQIHAATSLEIESGATLQLQAGGTLVGTARRILHEGAIQIPSGTVKLQTASNFTTDESTTSGSSNPDYIPQQLLGPERIQVTGGGVIEVGGERVDNALSMATKGEVRNGRLNGGKIELLDYANQGEGVVLEAGSSLIVNGGYQIAEDGTVSGGDGGKVDIRGTALILDGDLYGLSLLGQEGGTIDLQAETIDIVAESSTSFLNDGLTPSEGIPSNLLGSLRLAHDRLEDTGFSSIHLISVGDVTIETGAYLTPSNLKLTAPTPMKTADAAIGSGLGDEGVITVFDDFLGENEITIVAGALFSNEKKEYHNFDEATASWLDTTATVTLDDQAGLVAAIYGSIRIEASGIEIGGLLQADAGAISLVKRASSLEENTLHIQDGALLQVKGKNIVKLDESGAGIPSSGTALDAGAVSLESEGQLLFDSGATIDISAAEQTLHYLDTGDGILQGTWIAGDAGSVTFSYLRSEAQDGSLALKGTIDAGHAALDGVGGGSLTFKNNGGDGLRVDSQLVSLIGKDIASLQLISIKPIVFDHDHLALSLSERLGIDTPMIQIADSESGDDFPAIPEIRLSAQFVDISNNGTISSDSPVLGDATLIIDGVQGINVSGAISISNFSNVVLKTEEDLKVEELTYVSGNTGSWSGGLETAASMLLQSDQIYPTSQSRFVFHSSEGSIHIQNSDSGDPNALLSAGGTLIFAADTISQNGTVKAPMGEIVFCGDIRREKGDSGIWEENYTQAEQIVFGEKSVTSTTGEASVFYGALLAENNLSWEAFDHSYATSATVKSDVAAAPSSAVSVYSQAFLAEPSSTIDASGSGKIYSYRFDPGIEGSENPFEINGRMIILPDNPDLLDGAGVYFSGGSMLEAGEYALLPAEYAFVPGALIIEDQGAIDFVQQGTSSRENYTQLIGYLSEVGTDVQDATPHLFTIRPASEVLEEGLFEVKSYTAGDGGTINLLSDTTLIRGTMNIGGLDGFTPGTLVASGVNARLISDVSALADYNEVASLLSENAGNLILVVDDLFETDRGNIVVSARKNAAEDDSEKGGCVTLTQGTQLKATDITITAEGGIELQQESALQATDAGGTITLTSSGEIAIRENALVHAADTITLDTNHMDLEGSMISDNGMLALRSDMIQIVPDVQTASVSHGLVLSQSQWSAFSDYASIALTGRESVVLHDDVTLQVQGVLSIDTGLIAHQASAENHPANVVADQIVLHNTHEKTDANDLTDRGRILFRASSIDVGQGEIRIDGTKQVDLQSAGKLVFYGDGKLQTDADLTLLASAIGAEGLFGMDAVGEEIYVSTDFLVESTAGNITILSNEDAYDPADSFGGKLHFRAASIHHGGVIDIPAGTIIFESMGNSAADSIALQPGATINVDGNDYVAGGNVALLSELGGVRLQSGSVISVAAGTQGDAGGVEVTAANGKVLMEEGTLLATGTGVGGSFWMDSQNIGDLGDIANILAQGMFTHQIDLHSRQDGTGDSNLYLPADAVLQAQLVQLTADDGNIEIHGTITGMNDDTSSLITLNAGNDLTLAGNISIAGSRTSSTGAEVYLNAANGFITLSETALIDAENTGGGKGGVVYFRAQREGNEVKMDLDGRIQGAVQIIAEGFERIESAEIAAMAGGQASGAGVISQKDIAESAQGFIEELDWNADQLDAEGVAVTVVPGVEIVSDGDLAILDDWALTTERYGDDEVFGALTLRAAQSITFGGSITDEPYQFTSEDNPQFNSWVMRITAGADLESANVMAIDTSLDDGEGQLVISNGQLIYSESAPIWFASAGDTVIGLGKSVALTYGYLSSSLMSFNKTVRGQIGGSLEISGGAIQSYTGDVTLEIGDDLELKSRSDGRNNVMGSIRTVGLPSSDEDLRQQLWSEGGGDIHILVGGNVTGVPRDESEWDVSLLLTDSSGEKFYAHAANYGQSNEYGTQGIVNLGGGLLSVTAGGDIYAPMGNFGDGNLEVHAGGSLDGRFLVKSGFESRMIAGEDFGCKRKIIGGGQSYSEIFSQFELFDSSFSVTAQGTVQIGSMINPTIASDEFNLQWNLSYSQDAGVYVEALNGNAIYRGESDYYNGGALSIVPPNVGFQAGRDILLYSGFTMPPAQDGQLSLIAMGDIKGRAGMVGAGSSRGTILMADLAPGEVYGEHSFDLNDSGEIRDKSYFINRLKNKNLHASTPLHTDDATPIYISAGGDILDLSLILPKQATIQAGNDIRNFQMLGQTINANDVNFVLAGNDILLESMVANDENTGIESTGPGSLIVQAGNQISLGATGGIQSTGSLRNPYLANGESDLVVVAGIALEIDFSGLSDHFEALKKAGEDYSNALADGDQKEATEIIDETRATIISELIPDEEHGTGDIDLVKSQISTSGNQTDVYIIAAGDVNVGQTALDSGESGNTGIYTTSGGSVNVYAVNDLNVNESRVVTFGGGDIIVWSDDGDINAGRGSRTAISTSSPETKFDMNGDAYVSFTPPAVGSGIRALTFDPDGAEGPMKEPEIGDIYLFAPEGQIDAGEAGIKGKNIFLGAQEVVNAQNIEVVGTSVGVPDTSGATASMAALAGTGSVSETSKVAEETTGMRNAEARFQDYVADMSENLVPKWVAVEVVGFGKDEDEEKDR